MAFPLVLIATVALLGTSVHAHDLPSTAGVRLRERVLYFGQAQFQGVTPVVTKQQGVNSRQATSDLSDVGRVLGSLRGLRRRTARPGLSSVTGRTNVFSGTTPNMSLNVAPGTQSIGLNGISGADSRYSGVGNFTNTQFRVVPPDVSLCAGNGFIVQPINTAMAVYSSSGTLLAGILPINQFLGLLPARFKDANGVNQTGDVVNSPSCIYDTDTKRFFLSAWWLAEGSTVSALAVFAQIRTDPLRYGTGTIVAVSSSSDPTQHWAVYFIPGTNDGLASNNDLPAPLNYPGPSDYQAASQTQVDSNGIYIASNQWGYVLPINSSSTGIQFFGANIYALSKRLLIGNVFSFEATRFAIPYSESGVGLYSFTIRPARPAGDTQYEGDAGGTTYFVSNGNQVSPRSSVALWVLSNTASLNSLTQDLRLQQVIVTTPAWDTAPYSVSQRSGPIPFGISQNGSNVPADLANDAFGVSITSAAFQGGKVMFTLSAVVGNDVGVAYGVLKPSINWRAGTVVVKLEQFQQFGVTGHSLMYPAINMNCKSRIIISFTLVGPSYFPSAAYTTVASTGKLSTSVFIASAGTAPLDQFDGYPNPGVPGTSLFGGWNTVVIDEKGRSWSAVEFVSATRTDGINLATSIFRVDL